MRDRYSGRVVLFDDHRGRGEIEAGPPGGPRYGFHCTAIADGSRTIAAGADVDFALVIGPLGQLEASSIRPRGG